MEVTPDTVIAGKYRVLCPVGAGGMGSVYAAENLVTHKRVALKFMHPQLMSQPDAVERFLREAQVASSLRHPNVVDVYDVLAQDGMIVMVMELLEGEPLSSLMDRETSTVPSLIALLIPAMRGTACAHAQGIVHRDIKPANIFLAREGDGSIVPKVLDFGIAKIRNARSLALTTTGGMIGTPLYMSLEQLRGQKDLDARTDVYAFGVMLYEAVTGQPPYLADTITELAIKIATSEPAAPKALSPSIPSGLNRLIEWAMAKQRDDRIASLDLLARGLEPYATAEGYAQQLTAAHTELAHDPQRSESIPGTVPMNSEARLLLLQRQGAAAAQLERPVTGAPAREVTVKRETKHAKKYASAALVLLLCAGAAYATVKDKKPRPAPLERAQTVQPSAARPESAPVKQVWLRSEPMGAEVVSDGRVLGVTPLSVPLAAPKRIELRLAQYKTSSVQLDPATQAEVTARLERQRASAIDRPAVAAVVAPPQPVQPIAASAKPQPLCPPGRPWQVLPPPRRGLGGLFNGGARRRREPLLVSGPQCRSIAEAQAAYKERMLDLKQYEDTVWVLHVWRDQQVEQVAQELANKRIDRPEYQRRVNAIDARIDGRAQ